MSADNTRRFRACDNCHTTVPGTSYPKQVRLDSGRTEWLCMHCLSTRRHTEGAVPVEDIETEGEK